MEVKFCLISYIISQTDVLYKYIFCYLTHFFWKRLYCFFTYFFHLFTGGRVGRSSHLSLDRAKCYEYRHSKVGTSQGFLCLMNYFHEPVFMDQLSRTIAWIGRVDAHLSGTAARPKSKGFHIWQGVKRAFVTFGIVDRTF